MRSTDSIRWLHKRETLSNGPSSFCTCVLCTYAFFIFLFTYLYFSNLGVRLWFASFSSLRNVNKLSVIVHNAPLAIRYPPDIRPRPLPGLIFSNIRPRSVTKWISTCGLDRFATCSLRSAECHRVKLTANLVCVISEVTGAQLVTAAQHTLRKVGSLL